MSYDNHDDSPSRWSAYDERWGTPEVQQLLRRHFGEQLEAGIFSTYNQDVARLIATSDAYHPEDIERLTRQATSGELLFAVAADTAGDIEGEAIVFASPIALVKVNPNTGKCLYGSFVSVAEVEAGIIKQLYGSFTHEQAEMLLRQGNEQIAVGLHPELVYGAGYIS